MDPHAPTSLQTAPPVAPKPLKEPPRSSTTRSPKRWVWLVVVLIVAAAVYFEWPKIKEFTAAPQPPASTGKGRGKGGGGVTPVVATRAHKGNINIYFTGLGAVTPIYTVTVKSRVDGQLMQVMFKEGQTVHLGDTLLEIDPRPYQVALEQAEGQLVRDQALLKNAHVDLDRYKVLLAQQAIPEQTYATQEALVTQDEGVIKTDQAGIDSAKLNLVYCHITSPITGVVGLRLVDPGNIVHASDTNGLVVITQIDPISVIFTVAEDQIPRVVDKIHAGQTLTVEAWDRENNNKIATGTLQTIDNQIDQTTGTLRLRAVFDNKNNKLFPSQFVNARLLVETKSNVTLVQNAAIQRNSQSTYVWLVKPDSTVTIRPVTVGNVEGEQAEVTSGLDPGDEAVTVGVDKLQEGGRVNAQVPGEQPSNPQGGRRGKAGK
jgi:multidrug efflux system membrane fusion protein